MPGTYYLEPAESGCIGLTRINAGHSGRWDRIVQSVRDDIALHRRLPGFRQLIQSRRFEITVLTVLPAKAERIASDLQSLPEVKHVPVHVVAQPELLPLNQNQRNEVWFNVTVSRLYRDGDRWQDTTSFRRDDLNHYRIRPVRHNHSVTAGILIPLDRLLLQVLHLVFCRLIRQPTLLAECFARIATAMREGHDEPRIGSLCHRSRNNNKEAQWKKKREARNRLICHRGSGKQYSQ